MDYEKAFSDFLDSKEYDKAERAIFELTRQAFKAGRLSVRNDKPDGNKILEIKSIE